MSCNDASPSTRLKTSRRNLMGTLLYTLCTDEVFTATTQENDGWDEFVLTEGEFETMGPAILDLVAHAQGSNFSADFKYDVVLQYRGPLGPWATASTNLIAATTSPDYTISASPFADRTKLGLQIRVVLRTTIKNPATKTQKGNLNISLAVRLYQGC